MVVEIALGIVLAVVILAVLYALLPVILPLVLILAGLALFAGIAFAIYSFTHSGNYFVSSLGEFAIYALLLLGIAILLDVIDVN